MRIKIFIHLSNTFCRDVVELIPGWLLGRGSVWEERLVLVPVVWTLVLPLSMLFRERCTSSREAWDSHRVVGGQTWEFGNRGIWTIGLIPGNWGYGATHVAGRHKGRVVGPDLGPGESVKVIRELQLLLTHLLDNGNIDSSTLPLNVLHQAAHASKRTLVASGAPEILLLRVLLLNMLDLGRLRLEVYAAVWAVEVRMSFVLEAHGGLVLHDALAAGEEEVAWLAVEETALVLYLAIVGRHVG